MRLSLIFYLIAISIQGYGQSVLPGTNIQIDLPNGFEPADVGNSVAGFTGPDNSLVMGAQMQMPVTIETSFSEQEKSLKNQGFDILSKESIEHEGYKGILIEYQGIEQSQVSLILIFGEKGFQNFVSSIFPKLRLAEFRSILLSSTINDEINIKCDEILGFSAIDKCGNLELTSQNSLLMYYEYKNELGELTAYLNLTKYLKEKCLDQGITACLDVLANKYFPNDELIAYDVRDYSEGSGERRVYKSTSGTQQINYLTMIESVNFNMMIVGGTSNEEDIECLDKIVTSINVTSYNEH